MIFKPEIVDTMREGFSEDLRAAVSRLPQNMYGLTRFVIENRSRNRASMNPLKVYANRTNAFTPGLSKDFITHAAVIPFREKQQGRFYRDLFAKLDKRSLAIPVLSGGELVRITPASMAYQRERLRIGVQALRARHPSLFPGIRGPRFRRSSFLDERLLEENDPWLDPHVRDNLTAPGAGNYRAWKLLFHWKAWQWVHEGRLEAVLGERKGG